MRIGLVSDTHGRFDPLLPRLFAGCERILHAGDVVGDEVLAALSRIAPVDAVRGNNDPAGLPEELRLDLDGFTALVIHEVQKARPKGERILLYGHSHLPKVETKGGLLKVNPGSAGPRRFRLPRSAGLLVIDGDRARITLHDLEANLAPLGPPFDLDR